MKKKTYSNPTITIVEMQGGDLLEGLSSGPGAVTINPNGTITKGNANTGAAGKLHYDLWDYDEDEIEDYEDKEEEKKGSKR